MKSQTKRILNNQAIGIVPILLSMILDLYVSHVASFLIGISFCLLLLLAFHLIVRKDVYQFLLLPTLLTYICYSVFLFFDIEASLNLYSPIVAEILLVSILGFTVFFKRSVLRHYKDMQRPYQVMFRSTLTEAFFVAEVIQTLYTLYLFVALLYTHLPEDSFRSDGFIRIFYHYTGAAIGLSVIVYEQVRIYMINKRLGEEVWLPVLDDKGRVTGSVAQSIGQKSHKKYYHPVVRIAVVCHGMLYLTKREADAFISPGQLDLPFRRYVLFRHSRESTALSAIEALGNDPSIKPRFMIHYTFENRKVKQLVSLYAIVLQNEAPLQHIAKGKLWTVKQIEANMGADLFSEYFYKEFPYLQSTLLAAGNVSP
ncbi:MAG: hypothetical protein LBS05_10570 [Tannerellaceae bacterium]|jgi:hypothetical protein|nr:hypothetical protein [Tannerellaceae bacterium]